MKSKDLYPSESDLNAVFTFRMRLAILRGHWTMHRGDGLEGTGPAITATQATGHGDSPRDSNQGTALIREGHTS